MFVLGFENVSETWTTPKKLDRPEETIYTSSWCRLCLKLCDVTHCKNVSRKTNSGILEAVEDIMGNHLPPKESLLYLMCRPCERRLRNCADFKRMICKSQESLKEEYCRVKRCVELSPSVAASVAPTLKRPAQGKQTSRPPPITRFVLLSKQVLHYVIIFNGNFLHWAGRPREGWGVHMRPIVNKELVNIARREIDHCYETGDITVCLRWSLDIIQ